MGFAINAYDKRSDLNKTRLLDKIILFLIIILIPNLGTGQEDRAPWYVDGLWTGEVNAAIRDAKIGAAHTPFYEDKRWGGQSWLHLNVYNPRWRFEARLDGYQNSILRNPEDVYTRYGVGYINASLTTTKVGVEIGHFYGQIGHGLIMRSYRDLSLQIDNAIFGAKLKLDLPGKQSLMVFGGVPTGDFSFRKMINTGGEYRIDWKMGEVLLNSGLGASWKRYNPFLTDALIQELQFYHPDDKVPLHRNGWLSSLFQELYAGPLTIYAEFAVKRNDPYYNAEASRRLVTGEIIQGRFESRPGQALYTRIGGDFDVISVGVEGKYIQRFINKSDPFSFDYRNELNFIPPSADVRTYRLQSRYIPATQYLGEKSIQAFVLLPRENHLWEWKNGLIFQLDGNRIYSDYDLQWTRTGERSKWVAGLMYQEYHQGVYEGKGGQSWVKSTIPYVEYYTTWTKSRSMKTEAQALLTRQDKGSLYFLSAEFAWSAAWSIFGSGMYQPRSELWYPAAGLFYTSGQGRFGMSFVKQLDGYVCSGGICRYEPAYSGFKFEFQQRL